MSAEEDSSRRVCVTGAGGYVASWVVKFLLAKGYTVHENRPGWFLSFSTYSKSDFSGDEKNAHLRDFENASEKLRLFRAELLDYEALCAAISGCNGVFHVASPVPPARTVSNHEVELIERTGTRNVLNACRTAKVKRVVVFSSVSAVMWNPDWPKDMVMDEECWSDQEFCKLTENPYSLGKTLAEIEAWDYTKRTELDIVTVCPSFVIGPMLQPKLNATSLLLLSLLTGTDGHDTVQDRLHPFVDVRDVAEALILVYEKPEAKGRYICAAHLIRTHSLVDSLKSMYPNYSYPKGFTHVDSHLKLSSNKLQHLGWKYRPLEESIGDTVRNYEERDLLSSV